VKNAVGIVLKGLAMSATLGAAISTCASVAKSEKGPPMGILAASTGNQVTIVDPATGNSTGFSSGPVAWLFPAPGGVLFAPDLVHSRTTVIDLRSLTVQELISGVTMPHFGQLTDRYLVLSNQLLVMSYPERALINRFEIGFEHPWQVAVVADDTVLFVLERSPEGDGDASLTAVNLSEGRLVFRRPLGGDVRRFALSFSLGLMALAAADTQSVLLVDPATLAPISAFPIEGKPVDVAFAAGGSTLLTAVQRNDGAGEILIWELKREKKKGLRRKKEWTVPLETAPIRLATSPDERHVAAALESAQLQVVELKGRVQVMSVGLSEVPRDVVWCNPWTEGPLVPDWSDDDAPSLGLEGR
jgi:DNA-binding beta-propeller fold protein YncE